MAEIRTERTQNNVLPWLLGLALLALVIIGLVLAMADSASGADAGGAREVGTTQEEEQDETPRRLQQWAFAPRTEPARAALASGYDIRGAGPSGPTGRENPAQG